VSNKAVEWTPEKFEFDKVLQAQMDENFGDIMGIEPWMWLTLGMQLILEGYGFGIWNIFTALQFVATMVAGTKLQMVNDALTRQVFLRHDCIAGDAHGKNSVNAQKLHEMQMSRDFKLLADLEPEFWFNDPEIIEFLIKFCVWQNAVSLSLFGYYWFQFEMVEVFHTCFWESRTGFLVGLNCAMILFTLFVLSMRVVPVYGVISLSAEHNATMVKRRAAKHGGHGRHREHGNGGSHESESGSHGESNGESNGGSGDHGESTKVKVVPLQNKSNEKSSSEKESTGEISSWGRESTGL
jgi:hypothetical protein